MQILLVNGPEQVIRGFRYLNITRLRKDSYLRIDRSFRVSINVLVKLKDQWNMHMRIVPSRQGGFKQLQAHLTGGLPIETS